jgi:tetratricopeptide (TPR) repeat protein
VPRTILLAVVAVLTCAGASIAQGPEDYAGAVEEYRSGDPNEAIRRVARWPASTVTESLRQWAKAQPGDRLVAGVMLHTELGAAILDSLPHQTTVQLAHAQDLLDALALRRDGRERADAVRLRWYRFVISLFSSNARLADADRYAREALGKFARDPVLIFEKGVIFELSASHNMTPPPSPSMMRGRAPDSATHHGRTLEAAASEYRRALEIDPHLAVVRLHLGWVRVQQGDGRAGDDLLAVLADAKDERTRYLAHLFLGGAAERRRDFEEAAKAYDAAHQLGREHQTPFIALSRVELARGREDRARALVRELAALQRVDDDPWWSYHLGSIDEEALQWLRDEAHRR